MRAEKGNKTYNISDSEKQHYIALGFDIKSDNGKTIAYGKGKTVTYEKYAELEASHNGLMKEHEKLQKLYSESQKKEKASQKGKEPEKEPEKESEKEPEKPLEKEGE